MSEKYDVVCYGNIEPGYTRQQVEKNLCTLFKAPLTKIQKTFFSGTSPTIVKKHVAYDMAVQYVAALTQAGIVTCVEHSHDEQTNMSQQKMIRHPTQNTSQPTDASLPYRRALYVDRAIWSWGKKDLRGELESRRAFFLDH